MNYLEIKKDITRIVRDRIDMSVDMSDEEIAQIVALQVMEQTSGMRISIKDRERLKKEIFHSIRKLDILQEFIEDPSITEVMINGYRDIFYEKNGRIIKSKQFFESKEKLEDVIQQIVASCNRAVNESDPIVDARLTDGSRVNIVLSPPAMLGPVVTIRKFSDSIVDLDTLVAYGSISKEAAEFLKAVVKSGYNCFVSGGTSSGKTTLLNALANEIPRNQRVITIEDSCELRIRNIDNLVSLETRNSNSSGCKEITIRDLIRSSLRMRPDRIIVGEVRGEEALDMLQAFNTGHEGSLSTAHANSAEDMLSRLETMVLFAKEIPISAIRSQIVSAIDILIHLERSREGKRRVVEIVELDGYDGERIKLRTLYSETSPGVLTKVNEINNKRKLVEENELSKL